MKPAKNGWQPGPAGSESYDENGNLRSTRQLRLKQNVYEEHFESSSIFLRTQSDKNVQYFEMDMDFRQWVPSSMNLTLCYDLPTKTNNTATLDASCNVPVYEYTLKAKNQEQISPKYYEAKADADNTIECCNLWNNYRVL